MKRTPRTIRLTVSPVYRIATRDLVGLVMIRDGQYRAANCCVECGKHASAHPFLCDTLTHYDRKGAVVSVEAVSNL